MKFIKTLLLKIFSREKTVNWKSKKTGIKVAGGVTTAALVPAAIFLVMTADKGAQLTAAFEGLVLKNYIDVVGVETWCYGETQMGRMESGYTKEYCQTLFNQRFNQYSARMYACYNDETKQYVTPAMHAAFTDVAYNVGRYCNTGMVRALAKAQPVAACDFILNYKRAGGKDCSIRSNGCYGVWDRRVKMHGLCVKEARLLEEQIKNEQETGVDR